tara:strand:- start:248 stop:946 length:699 start_codon:yes stop_codon:yes gene_type:complete
MHKNNHNLCIILARGGSKGLKNKNIIDFYGKPLIYYTIKPILDSKLFNKVIVSTDSKKIKEYSINFGAEVPFLRPKYLSDDKSSYKDALRHALIWTEKNYGRFQNVLYAYPTNPLREKEDFIEAHKLLLKKKSDLIISVTEDTHPIYWSNKIKKNYSMKNFVRAKYCKNRQLLPKTYHVDGSIWFGKWETFYKKRNFYKVNSHAMIYPTSKSIDIDNEYDLLMAKLKYEKKR